VEIHGKAGFRHTQIIQFHLHSTSQVSRSGIPGSRKLFCLIRQPDADVLFLLFQFRNPLGGMGDLVQLAVQPLCSGKHCIEAAPILAFEVMEQFQPLLHLLQAAGVIFNRFLVGTQRPGKVGGSLRQRGCPLR